MGYRALKLAFEYDGDQHRSSTTQYERDLSRLDAIRRAGWVVIQVRRHGLFSRPDVTVAKVRAALREAGWRG
jgi:very-short-patch-repair endonuclease